MFQRNKKTVEGTMNIMSVEEVSERWNISERWIQKCFLQSKNVGNCKMLCM